MEREVGAIQRIDIQGLISSVFPNVRLQIIVDQALEKFMQKRACSCPRTFLSSDNNLTFAETENVDGLDGAAQEPSQGLKGLLYHIAEAEAKRKAYEHRGIHCDECGEAPIRGVRWHCLNCPSFDLCSTCEAHTMHDRLHVFVKIKIPIPVLSQPVKEYPILYPGSSNKDQVSLRTDFKKMFEDEHHFEATQIDAMYDQFFCLANATMRDDSAGLGFAIDRKAFDRALTSVRWPQPFIPNLVYDRIFAFYDTDSNGRIGFEEFISGLAYLRSTNRFTPLHRAIQGFDIDGDGYVDRQDFIRLCRAKHDVRTLIHSEMADSQEIEQTQFAMETLQSSQPISSIFSREDIPEGEHRHPTGKKEDPFGDMQPPSDTETILRDNEGWSNARTRNQPSQLQTRNSRPQEAHERRQGHLSRFEEMLNSSTDDLDVHVGQSRFEDAYQIDGNWDSGGSDRSTDQKVNGSQDDSAAELRDQDIIWQLLEAGYHEVLNPFFKARERKDQEAIDTRKDRQKWRKEIEEYAEMKRQREVLEQDLRAGSEIDPLMATAMTSFANGDAIENWSSVEVQAAFARSQVVPTDPESLARRETEIAQQPLEELLSATGYSAIENDWGRVNSVAPEGSLVPSDQQIRSPILQLWNESTIAFSEHFRDPTMPQNRPNSASASTQGSESNGDFHHPHLNTLVHSGETGVEERPSKERLEYYAKCQEHDRELQLRGGIGRLSFNEVEELVRNDSSRELKGLVTSWLEWASF